MKAHYPWPQYRRDWDSLIALEIDGAPADELVSTEVRRIDLTQLESWEMITLRVSTETTEQPFTESIDERALALISVPRTNCRLPVELRRSGGKFMGELEVRASQLTGTATLTVSILDASTMQILGSSGAWAIVADPSEAPPKAGVPPIDTVWCNFSKSDKQLVYLARYTYAVLDVSPQKPVLYLNESIDGFQQLILSKAPRSEKRRLRSVIVTSIAKDVTRSLFRAALDSVIVNNDQPELPNDHLRREVLEKVAAEVSTVANADELCWNLLIDSDPVSKAGTWAAIEIAIDGLVHHSLEVSGSVTEVKYV